MALKSNRLRVVIATASQSLGMGKSSGTSLNLTGQVFKIRRTLWKDLCPMLPNFLDSIIFVSSGGVNRALAFCMAGCAAGVGTKMGSLVLDTLRMC